MNIVIPNLPNQTDQTNRIDQTIQTNQPNPADQPEANIFYNNTYTVVSTAAYLIGVPERIFQSEFESPRQEVFDRLEKEKSARIIRNLCILRTSIERNFKNINDKMQFEYKGLLSLPEYIPQDTLTQLSQDGINIIKSNHKLVYYIIDINRLIMDRINNCKDFFPVWLNWQYLRDIFIMPDGLTEEGTRRAADLYYMNKNLYPYRMYINWPPSEQGNILYNDKKFVTLLYQWNHDSFEDLSKVSDASYRTKNNIYRFLDESENAVVVVDCENSDPYKLCAVLNHLDQEMLEKITRIILFDDVHTTDAWAILQQYVSVPIEHNVIERIKQNKSLVDIRLTADACKEFYQNKADSFIIVSSDSDYWGLISALPDASFLVMIEREKCGPDMKSALAASGIFYCFIDDFYSGDSQEIVIDALVRETRKYLDFTVRLNVNDLMDHVLAATRANLTDAEKKAFFDKYIKPMHLHIDDNGDVKIELNPWK